MKITNKWRYVPQTHSFVKTVLNEDVEAAAGSITILFTPKGQQLPKKSNE